MPRGPKGDGQTRRVSSTTHRAPGRFGGLIIHAIKARQFMLAGLFVCYRFCYPTRQYEAGRGGNKSRSWDVKPQSHQA
jgi:hypothetical protein